jgi:hypothetical protein
LRFFLLLGPRPRAGGCPSPFEPFMKGLRPEPDHMALGSMLLCAVMFHVGRRREQTPPIVFVEGEARRRGGGTIYAAKTPPPKHDEREGCAALGGLSTMSSPRCFMVRVDVTVCEGYTEMEGGRRGGLLHSLFILLGEAAGGVRGLPRYGAGGRPRKGVPGIGVSADKCG